MNGGIGRVGFGPRMQRMVVLEVRGYCEWNTSGQYGQVEERERGRRRCTEFGTDEGCVRRILRTELYLLVPPSLQVPVAMRQYRREWERGTQE